MKHVLVNLLFIAAIHCQDNEETPVQTLEKVINSSNETIDMIEVFERDNNFVEKFEVVDENGNKVNDIELVEDKDKVEQLAIANEQKLKATDVSDRKISNKLDVVAAVDIDINGVGCNCKGASCGCCFKVQLPWFGWVTSGCLVFGFSFETYRFDIQLNYNSIPVYHRIFQMTDQMNEIEGSPLRKRSSTRDIKQANFEVEKPLDFCVPLTIPVPFVPIRLEACVKVSNITLKDSSFNFCVASEFVVLKYKLGNFDFGCLNMDMTSRTRSYQLEEIPLDDIEDIIIKRKGSMKIKKASKKKSNSVNAKQNFLTNNKFWRLDDIPNDQVTHKIQHRDSPMTVNIIVG